MKKSVLVLAFLIYVLSISIAIASDATKLTGYGADLSKSSLSGMSSGAFMTAQFHVAYSDMVIGAGIVAGGPYFCAGYKDTNLQVEYKTQ